MRNSSGDLLRVDEVVRPALAEQDPATVQEVGGNDVLAIAAVVKSKSEARRLGSVTVNGAVRRVDDRVVATDLLYGRWVLLRKGRTYHLVDAK